MAPARTFVAFGLRNANDGGAGPVRMFIGLRRSTPRAQPRTGVPVVHARILSRVVLIVVVRSPSAITYRPIPARNIHSWMVRCRMSGLPSLVSTPEDRRRHRRYPIRLECQYTLLKGIVTQTGSGRTINISTRGVLFEADRPLPERGEIVLELAWPVLLDGVRRLKFVVRGRIVRSDGKSTAVRVTSFDFHTKRSSK
jgi:hypothetical protein